MTVDTTTEIDVSALTGAVSEDTRLTPAEKETTIRFAKDQDLATIFTSEAGLMRRLIAHPETEIQSLDVFDNDGQHTSMQPEEYDTGAIAGIVATVSVSMLQVKSSPRKTDQHADVVSEQVIRGEQ